MPKKAKELSAIEVKRLTAAGLYAVGGVAGLLLQVTSTGARSWILRTMVGAKRRDIGLGGYPDVTLTSARDKAREHKAAIVCGRDPVAERKAARLELIRSQARSMTFKEAAKRCHAVKSAEFRNEKHAKQWMASLEKHAFPIIGERPVSDIQTDEILAVLQPIWEVIPETASNVRRRMENVFDHAIASKLRGTLNPAVLKGCLQPLLPKTDKLKKKQARKHHPALAIHDMPRFMAKLREQPGLAARALEFAILTASRPSEAIGSKVDKKAAATWSEIDNKKGHWIIPCQRMKAGEIHTVPLSAAALAVLAKLPRLGGDTDYIFPAANGGLLSNAAMSAVIKRMHAKDIDAGKPGFIDPREKRVATPHGFRSSFKDWSLQEGRFPDEWSELALAHVNDDKTRAAYARGELIEERAGMMSAWAEFLAGA
jgi:integrase